MVFSSMSFLFIFLPAVTLFYFAVPRRRMKLRNLVLLLFSLFFYFYGEPLGIFVMLASILGNYYLALGIAGEKRRRLLLVLAIAGNLLLLGYFKYTGFVAENLAFLIRRDIPIPAIVMPIGISFFTFQGMSYVLDVYRRRVPAQHSILVVATYIVMFPQLVAGPIVRYETVAVELEERKETLSLAAQGIQRFIFGLAKKMLLSNALGEAANLIFLREPETLAAPLAWVGAIAYSFQIFFDFSGYSDMAIGLGQLFGFNFPENFNYPYIAQSITDFWRRWHMSLSTWFRDYVYIPLGGSRRGLPRQLLNICIVWALTGIWHGAAWNFVIWGLYFALLLTLEKIFLLRVLSRIPRFFGHIYALLLIVLGWVIFNSPDLSHALGYMGAMLRFVPGDPQTGEALGFLLQYLPEFSLALLLSMPLIPALGRRFRDKAWYAPVTFTAALILFALSFLSVVSSSFNPFIYFRF